MALDMLYRSKYSKPKAASDEDRVRTAAQRIYPALTDVELPIVIGARP